MKFLIRMPLSALCKINSGFSPKRPYPQNRSSLESDISTPRGRSTVSLCLFVSLSLFPSLFDYLNFLLSLALDFRFSLSLSLSFSFFSLSRFPFFSRSLFIFLTSFITLHLISSTFRYLCRSTSLSLSLLFSFVLYMHNSRNMYLIRVHVHF